MGLTNNFLHHFQRGQNLESSHKKGRQTMEIETKSFFWPNLIFVLVHSKKFKPVEFDDTP